MLIGIRHPHGVEAGAEYAKEVAKFLKGPIRIFDPRNMEEYDEALAAYRPHLKKHLILLRTHHELLKTQDTAHWRAIELYFDNKGGALFGVEPETYKNLWISGLPADPELLVKHSTVSTYRSLTYKKILGSRYFGRTSVDPHTVLVGNVPSRSVGSGISRQLLGSIPDTWGQEGDWSGVAFIPVYPDDKMIEAMDWLQESANVVALGPKADEALTRLGVDHGTVPIPVGNGRFKNQAVYPKYGIVLREAASRGEDFSDWKP